MNAAKTAQQQAQKLVKEGKCPTCQKPITPGDPLHSLSTVEIATDTHTALQSAHAQAVQALTAAENWFRTAQQIHKAALDAIPPIGPPKAPAFATSVDLAKRRITDIETAANPWQAQVQLATTQRYALQREIAVLQELAISAETEQRIADVWVDALAPTGARAHMAEGTLAAIESEANRWLSALSDGHLAVQFAPTKETAQGAVKDQIQTIVTFDGKERSFLAFSGGQKKRVNFAVDLGVASAFSRGGSLALSLLVLDEQLFSGLDEEGKRAVVHALNAAGVADVVVIDHDPALAMALPRAFQIVKAADKFSRIEAIR
jgi:DNA repair exonuclease SbcCD ATPase subunit